MYLKQQRRCPPRLSEGRRNSASVTFLKHSGCLRAWPTSVTTGIPRASPAVHPVSASFFLLHRWQCQPGGRPLVPHRRWADKLQLAKNSAVPGESEGRASTPSVILLNVERLCLHVQAVRSTRSLLHRMMWTYSVEDFKKFGRVAVSFSVQQLWMFLLLLKTFLMCCL